MPNGPVDLSPPSEDPMRMDQPPEEIDGLRLFERPDDAQFGRIVYQGSERSTFAPRRSVAHEYWIIERKDAREWNLVHAIATFNRGEGYHRHIEELVGTYRDTTEALSALRQHVGKPVGDTVVRHFDDGTIRFAPPFSKEQAAYRGQGDDRFDEDHDRCATCVHYIPGHGCHFVQGEIHPAAYCENFYADYGVFAHDHGDGTEINAELMGSKFAWDQRNIDDFLADLEGRLREAIGESNDRRSELY